MIRPLTTLTLAACVLVGFSGAARAGINEEEPLPRFEDRVCPGVAGLELEYAEQFVGRVRANAERFGLRLADPASCEPNLLIAFVEDGPAYLSQLVTDRGYLFSRMDRPDLDALLAQQGPVTVWHQVQQRTRDGIQVGTGENLMNLPRAGMWQAHSRIYRPIRNDITYSLVLFDSDAVTGMTLAQLADHASLRGFATAFPQDIGVEAHSLLDLFTTTDDRPPGLTAFDVAWLERLYDGIPNMPASVRLRGVRIEGG